MATSSYSTLFGTNGAGQTGSQAGISTMFGQQPRPRRPEDQQPAQTFAQLQQRGMARPAPQAPQGQPYQQFGGSQQAQQARSGMLSQLQQQLAQPTRFDTDAFKQIRAAQSAQLGAEYQGQQSQLNEELARRGLSASSIGGGRMGDLAGQQARALAGLDAQLLQAAAQTQAQDRLAAMQAAQGFAELAGSQDLAQFEANRVAQAAQFQQGLQTAQFEQGQTEFDRQQALAAAQAQQAGSLQGMDLALRRQLGLGELGLSERRQTAQETQFGQSLAEQTAARLQQAGLSGRELDLRAQQLQQEAATQGRQLTIEEARLAAQQQQFAQTQAMQQQQFGAQLGFNREELALRGELGRGEQQLAEQRLAQEGRLEEARQNIQLKDLGQREAQFQSTLGAEEQRFVRTLKEQQDARLQQLGVSTRQLDLDAARIKQEGELQGRQLTLQEARDVAEVDYRAKNLQQQATLAGQQITAEAARQQAQLEFQRDQLKVDEDLRREGIAVDRERITSQEKEADLERQLRDRLGMAELTGSVEINGQKVSTMAAQRLGQEGAQIAAQQAAQMTQATGMVYRVNAQGQVVPMTDADGKPVRSESSLARLSQEELARAELTGTLRVNGVDISTLAAKQLDQARLNQLAEQAARQSQLTGTMYKVDEKGQIVQELGTNGQPISTEMRRAQMQQEEQAKLDRQLRQQLGMAELTGQVTIGEGADARTQATLGAQQFNLSAQQQFFQQQQAQQNMLIQLAAALAQSTNIPKDDLTKMMKDLQDRLLRPQNQPADTGAIDFNSKEWLDFLDRLKQTLPPATGG